MGIAKTSILVLLGIVAIVLALIGNNFVVIAGLSLTWIAMGLIILDIAKILNKIPVLNMLSGRANPTHLGILFVALLLINIGAVGAIFAGNGGAAPAGGITFPTASVTTSSPATTGTGQTLQGEFEFWPLASAGGAYAISGDVYLVDNGASAYDSLKLVVDSGSANSLKLKGSVAPGDTAVSSGEFSINPFTGKIGDTISLFGYYDVTPAAAESKPFQKQVRLTGFNEQNQRWMWEFVDGSSPQFQWTNISTLDWYDSTETNRDNYQDNQTAAATNRVASVTFFPTNNGEEVIDGAIYFEATSATAGNFKKMKITGPTGKSVEYTSLSNADILSSSDPRYIAAPSKSGSSTTMYFVGALPEDYIRSSTSDKGKYVIDMTYDHSGSGNTLYYLHGVQLLNAKTNTGGHVGFADDFNFNMSTNVGTTGFS